jgi:hypothetical protein
MTDLNTNKNEQLEELFNLIALEYDCEPAPEFSPEQARVIALAFYLLTSRQNLTWLLDDLIMLISNSGTEMDYCRHTIKNLARFLNTLNHPCVRIH